MSLPKYLLRGYSGKDGIDVHRFGKSLQGNVIFGFRPLAFTVLFETLEGTFMAPGFRQRLVMRYLSASQSYDAL